MARKTRCQCCLAQLNEAHVIGGKCAKPTLWSPKKPNFSTQMTIGGCDTKNEASSIAEDEAMDMAEDEEAKLEALRRRTGSEEEVLLRLEDEAEEKKIDPP